MNKFSDLIYKTRKFVIEFVKKNKTKLLVVGVALVCSIAISIGIYSQVANKEIIEKSEPKDEEKYQLLKENFNLIFNNEKNEYTDISYDIEQEKNGQYNVNVTIPIINVNTDSAKKINEDINSLFVEKLKQIANRNK